MNRGFESKDLRLGNNKNQHSSINSKKLLDRLKIMIIIIC